MGHAFDLSVLGVIEDGSLRQRPSGSAPSRELLLHGSLRNLEMLRGLQDLRIEPATMEDLDQLETPTTSFAEAILSPHTSLVDRTLRSIDFRKRFGLSVLALRREGGTLHGDLGDTKLRFGDALLVYGRRDRIRLLSSDPDFLVLSEGAHEVRRHGRAPVAVAIVAGMIAAIVSGWLPVHLATLAGAVAMVVAGCLTMDEAYRSIEWRTVFLVSGMLTLGLALSETGAALQLARPGLRLLSDYGPYAALLALFGSTTVLTQILPSSAAAVLMAPIALNVADAMALNPKAMVMTVAIAASSSFQSPVAHTASVLVMGPGGYGYMDFLKAGLPLTLVVLVLTLLLLPMFWPLVS